MKYSVLTFIWLILLVSLTIGCGPKDNYKFVMCTMEYRSNSLKLIKENGNTYLADSIQVEYNGNVINSSRLIYSPDSSYELLSDNHMKYIPFNIESNLQCVVFKNNNVVKSFEFKATKDCCHLELISKIGSVVVD